MAPGGRCRSRFASLAALVVAILVMRPLAAPAQAPTLRIVVVEGEDAVNIIHQRAAVAPVVEVRDRNDQPVAGATVRFAVRAGKATFKGARTLSVTTDAAGRAVATGLAPTGTGTLEIGATATFQGQAAVATITQTNVMTAAEAAAAGGAGSGVAGGAAGGSSAAGGAAGAAAGGAAAGTGSATTGAAAAGAAATGGGIGLTTVAIAGAAVAGGTYAATQVVGGGGTQPQLKGAFAAQFVQTYVVKATGAAACTRTSALSGTFTFDYKESNGSIDGEFDDETDWTMVATTCANNPTGSQRTGFQLKVSGSPGAITGTGQRTGTPISGVTATETFQFTGSLSAGVLTGTYTMRQHLDLQNELGTGSTAIPATLR